MIANINPITVLCSIHYYMLINLFLLLRMYQRFMRVSIILHIQGIILEKDIWIFPHYTDYHDDVCIKHEGYWQIDKGITEQSHKSCCQIKWCGF